jgi:outer membrane protein assembly factor BamB
MSTKVCVCMDGLSDADKADQKGEKVMANTQQGLWSHNRQRLLARILFILATIGIVSACGSNATGVVNATPTAVRKVQTVYVAEQSGAVYALESGTGHVRWHKQLDKQGSIHTSIAVFGDVVYVGRLNGHCSPNCTGSIDTLKASNGTVLWHTKVDVHGDESENIKVMSVADGVVYVGGDGGFQGHSSGDVYALRISNGSLLWHYTISGGCCRGLVVTPTTIYIGELDHIDAVKVSDRTLLWHHQIDQGSVLLSLVVANGRVYIGTAVIDYNGPPKGSVDALRANDGTLAWHNQTNIASVVLTVENGVVYVGEFWGNVLDTLRTSDGSLIWQYQDKDSGDRGIAAAAVMDGVAYITSVTVGYADNGSTVDALWVKDGTHLWRYKIDQGQIGDAVAANELVYVSGPHGITALDGKNGNQRWFFAATNSTTLPVAFTVGP